MRSIMDNSNDKSDRRINNSLFDKQEKSKDIFEKLIENITLARNSKDIIHKKLAICSIQILINDLIKENNISHKDIDAVMQLMGAKDDNSK